MDKLKRILLVDDNAAIHEDFRKILNVEKDDSNLDQIEAEIFEKDNNDSVNTPAETQEELFSIDSAYQGEEALSLVKKALFNKQPYALAFVDVRMPPGMDGIVTVQRMLELDSNIQIVICTAYADYSWREIVQKLNKSNNYLILKKPFDVIEIRQLVAALTNKWELNQQVQYQIENLESLVEKRTAELEKNLSLIKATLESTPEGIVAISRDQRVMTYNKTFLKLWDISENTLLSAKSFIIFQRLSKQVDDSAAFLKSIINLCDKPEAGMQEWKLKSGKILEHYTQPQYLYDKIIGCVFTFHDITERKQLQDEILYQATHDSLTNLPNRILLIDRLEQAIAHAKRSGFSVGILHFNLDNFKEINESLGHKAGDTVLKLVAQRLTKYVREIDTVTRFGGDEFILLLVSIAKEESALTKAKQLLEEFHLPLEVENHSLIVTTSIGISFYPRDGEDPTTLLKNADAALYRAKELGRNTLQIYMREFNDKLLQRAELITSLRKALQNNEFTLNYQPLIQSQSGKIIGVEALIRWEHPLLGKVYPQTFIALAEETGLIVSIGEWVLKTACAQAKQWQKINPTLTMAVNISGYQFIQSNFVEMVQAILKETQLEASYLELEMTESHVFKNISETSEKMDELKRLGIRLSLDDFGTGYASFGYLKYFPFDKVKIDKTFIQGIDVNSSDDAIVEAIINMAHKMNIEVLAEGVETPNQIEFLLKHHGSQMQGYYYSPPVDVQSLTEILLNETATAKV